MSIEPSPAHVDVEAQPDVETCPSFEDIVHSRRSPSEHCFITNEPYVKSTPVLPPSLPGPTLNALEHAWRLQHNTLNVQHPSNHVPLTPTVQVFFNQSAFLLIPQCDVVQNLLDDMKKPASERAKSLSQTSCSYFILPTRRIRDYVIMRRDEIPRAPHPIPLDKPRAHYTKLVYPFRELGHLELSVPPELIIVRCVYELERIRWTDAIERARISKRLTLLGMDYLIELMNILFERWTAQPPEWFLEKNVEQERPTDPAAPLGVEEMDVPEEEIPVSVMEVISDGNPWGWEHVSY